MSPGSFIRSAARATSSAHRRIPIRWRLAGGSALLTLVILLRLRDRGRRADLAAHPRRLRAGRQGRGRQAARRRRARPDRAGARQAPLPAEPRHFVRSEDAAARLIGLYSGRVAAGVARRARPRPAGAPARPSTAAGSSRTGRSRSSRHRSRWSSSTAGRRTNVEATVRRVRLFLVGGVVGGAALALLAGLMVARRAMSPIDRADRHGAHDRAHARPRPADPRSPRPTTRSPSWRARSTGCSGRSTPRATSRTRCCVRQREFVADASHELRTPLTSVLANLEFLAETLARRAGRRGLVGAALLAPDAAPRPGPAAARPRRRPARRAARAARPRPRDRRGGLRARARRRRPRRSASTRRRSWSTARATSCTASSST